MKFIKYEFHTCCIEILVSFINLLKPWHMGRILKYISAFTTKFPKFYSWIYPLTMEKIMTFPKVWNVDKGKIKWKFDILQKIRALFGAVLNPKFKKMGSDCAQFYFTQISKNVKYNDPAHWVNTSKCG